MNTNNKETVGGCLGTIISLFGQKLKPTVAPAVAAKAPPPAEPAPLGRGRRILIADDDPVFAKATAAKLKAQGFTVVMASEGSAVVRTAQQEAPDAILLDIEFPPELPTSWDGFSILGWLKLVNTCPNTPVILCTGKRNPDLMRRAAALHADGVLHKPLDYAALLGLIDFKLSHRKSAQTIEPVNN